jgi:hypothetical protein
MRRCYSFVTKCAFLESEALIVNSEVSPDKIRAALNAVIRSDEFNKAVRLQELLAYVIEESLDGRGDKIPAKLISGAVYNRPIKADIDNENVVRVDAGRLRRRLGQYYLGAGKDDPVRIHIDPGGYAPSLRIGYAWKARLLLFCVGRF